jgi:hypothetical protein
MHRSQLKAPPFVRDSSGKKGYSRIEGFSDEMIAVMNQEVIRLITIEDYDLTEAIAEIWDEFSGYDECELRNDPNYNEEECA